MDLDLNKSVIYNRTVVHNAKDMNGSELSLDHCFEKFKGSLQLNLLFKEGEVLL